MAHKSYELMIKGKGCIKSSKR